MTLILALLFFQQLVDETIPKTGYLTPMHSLKIYSMITVRALCWWCNAPMCPHQRQTYQRVSAQQC